MTELRCVRGLLFLGAILALVVSTTPAQASNGETEHMLNTAQATCDQDCRKRQGARYVKEIQEHFTIKGEPIHPFVFRDFEGYMSDRRPVITAIDVLAGVNSNYYFSDDVKKSPYGYMARDSDGQSHYHYSFLGRLENGLLVVRADSNGGGSGVFGTLYFLDVFVDTASDDEGKPYTRVNLKTVRTVAMGDRWGGDITIDGNKVTISGTRMAHMGGPKTTRIIEVQRP